ncbi:MAG: MBL fold metallo-hydrolase [Candidatus Krumholzibacteriia bacterium]
MRLTFHGAARTVTGSRHLLETGDQRILIDCGLFQGLKKLRLLNWQGPGFDPGFLDHVVLTHAHIDHSGYLPRLMQYGFHAPVHCTPATAELLELMLMDAAHLQEEDAAWANKRGFSKHRPAEPLYTMEDAWLALKQLAPVDYGKRVPLGQGVDLRLHNVGHILGAACAEITVRDGDGARTLVFSGDVGRYDAPLHRDPDPLPTCDVLVVESTYGDRSHETTSVRDQIRDIFAETIERRGVVLIPAFAVGRVQLVTLVLRELMEAGELPSVPIHIDSPMAIDATLIYGRHLDDASLDSAVTEDGRSRLFPGDVHLHRTVHESKALNDLDGPRVIVASSGMMTGGRILHHLVRRLPRRENLILLTGYQAAGTRGRSLQEGARTLRIHGGDVLVGARVATMQGLSAHADGDQLLRWITSGAQPPSRVFVVHGEDGPAEALAARIAAETGAETSVPELGESVEL